MNELVPVQEALDHANRMNVFTPVGLRLPEKVTPLDYYCVAVQLVTTDTAVGWGRGDWALSVKKDFPDNYEEVWRELWPSHETGTLDNDARAAARYTLEDREKWTIDRGLSYSHCQKAGHLEPVDYRDYVLDLAAEQRWNVRMLENYINHGKPVMTFLPAPSHDVRQRVGEWLDTLPDPTDRRMAEYYVGMYIDWISQTTSHP